MWPFSKPKNASRAAAKRAPQTLVSVVYRDPSDPMPTTDPAHGYVYKWAAPTPPQLGMRVLAPASGNTMNAVIIGVGVSTPPGYTRRDLSTISQIVRR